MWTAVLNYVNYVTIPCFQSTHYVIGFSVTALDLLTILARYFCVIYVDYQLSSNKYVYTNSAASRKLCCQTG